MRQVKQRLVPFTARSERLRRGGCLPLFRILNPLGHCPPKRTPRASRGWLGSNFCARDNSRHSRNFTPPSSASPPRKAGNAWATGCASNAGSILYALLNRWVRDALKPCERRFRHGRNGNNASMRHGEQTRHDYDLSLKRSRQSFRPSPTMPCPSASGCIFIPWIVHHRQMTYLREPPRASVIFSMTTNGGVRIPNTRCSRKRRWMPERTPKSGVAQ